MANLLANSFILRTSGDGIELSYCSEVNITIVGKIEDNMLESYWCWKLEVVTLAVTGGFLDSNARVFWWWLWCLRLCRVS